jgi:hypothetical protein
MAKKSMTSGEVAKRFGVAADNKAKSKKDIGFINGKAKKSAMMPKAWHRGFERAFGNRENR